jgi:NAD(P)-dependent dehydrogenase (short-subunit alcohol dehydrogenase family)
MDGNVGSAGYTVYAGSKGAVRTMTKDVAIEYARRGVRVNSVHPGYIHMHMAEYRVRLRRDARAARRRLPVGHLGEPIDVAYGVL